MAVGSCLGGQVAYLGDQEAYLGDQEACLVGHSYYQEEVEDQEAFPYQEVEVAYPCLEAEVAFPCLEVEVAFPFLEVEEVVSHLKALHQEEVEEEGLNLPFQVEEVVEEAYPFLEEEEYLRAVADIAYHIII